MKNLRLFLLLIMAALGAARAFGFNVDMSVDNQVDSLLHEAKIILEDHPEKAKSIIENALQIADDGNMLKSRANGLNYLGLVYYNQKDYNTAINYFQQSLKVLFRIGDKEKVANMMKKIGLSYLNQKKYSKATEYYKFALKIFDQIDALRRKASTHVEMGVIYQLAERYKEASNEFDEAFEIYEKLGDKNGKGKVLHYQAKNYLEMGNLKKADTFFKLTIEVYEKYLDYEGLTTVLNNYGRALIEMKKHNAAAKTLQEAEDLCEQKQSLLYGKIASNYGTVLVYKSNYDKARTYLTLALEIAEKLNNKELKAQVYRILYELNFRNNDTRQALSYYQKYIAVKDTTATNIKPFGKNKDTAQLNNLMVFITVFSSVIILFLIIWLVIVIKQRDRAFEELQNKNLPNA